MIDFNIEVIYMSEKKITGSNLDSLAALAKSAAKVYNDETVEKKSKHIVMSDKFKDILDHITYGYKTVKEITYMGCTFELRILTAREETEVERQIDKMRVDDSKTGIAQNELVYSIEKMIRILCTALTPYGEESKFTLKEMGSLPTSFIYELYKLYINWVESVLTEPSTLSEEEIGNLLSIVRKKPQAARDLDYVQSLNLVRYLTNYCSSLEERINLGLDNLSS